MATSLYITDEELEAKVLAEVEEGIALLFEHLGPEWPDLVTEEELEMCSPTSCILGQVFADATVTEKQYEAAAGDATPVGWMDDGYYKGLAILDGDCMHHPDRYGFNSNDYLDERLYERSVDGRDDTTPSQWQVLDRVWKSRLGELKASLEARKADAS